MFTDCTLRKGQKRIQVKEQSRFPQNIIDLIADNFDIKQDKGTLTKLCKTSPSWKRAPLRKRYAKLKQINARFLFLVTMDSIASSC